MSTESPNMSDPAAMRELGDQLRQLVDAMTGDAGEGLGVPRVVQFAAVAVPGAQHAAISITQHGSSPRTIAATDDLPIEVDSIQYEFAEGPCVEALSTSDVLWSDDLRVDERWQRFGPRAAETAGVLSMASYRLFITDDRRAALNFYSTKTQAFDRLALGVGALFASYAAVTLLAELHRDKAVNLERALQSSREIGIAMGILMTRNLCTEQQAFDLLREASQATHRKLRDIAAEVKETGALPEPRGRH